MGNTQLQIGEEGNLLKSGLDGFTLKSSGKSKTCGRRNMQSTATRVLFILLMLFSEICLYAQMTEADRKSTEPISSPKGQQTTSSTTPTDEEMETFRREEARKKDAKELLDYKYLSNAGQSGWEKFAAFVDGLSGSDCFIYSYSNSNGSPFVFLGFEANGPGKYKGVVRQISSRSTFEFLVNSDVKVPLRRRGTFALRKGEYVIFTNAYGEKTRVRADYLIGAAVGNVPGEHTEFVYSSRELKKLLTSVINK